MTTKSFSGGEKLEARLKAIAANLAKGKVLKMGFLSGSSYPDGTSVPLVAATQEFGSPKLGIPPRPYFRTLIAEKSDEWGDRLAALLPACDYDVDRALGLMGETMVAELQESIIKTNSPPLSPVTLMLRKMRSQDQNLVVTRKTVAEAAARVAAGESTAGVSTAVLQDTGHLVQSAAYEVKDT